MSSTQKSLNDYYSIATVVLGLKLDSPNESGWANGRCPFHHDRHPSFGLNVFTGYFNCFRCGSGSFRTLLERSGVPPERVEELIRAVESNEELAESYRLAVESGKIPGNSDVLDAHFRFSCWARRCREILPPDAVEKMCRYFDYLLLLDPEEACSLSKCLSDEKNQEKTLERITSTITGCTG